MNNHQKNDSFIRWQATTVTQFGYTINLILTLAVASLGFETSLLLTDNFSPTGFLKYTFSASLISLVASIMLGIWCTVNRLRDFRATTKITRLRDKSKHAEEVSKLRELTKDLGKKTWSLFFWQIGTFTSGIIMLITTVALMNLEKLI